MTGHRSLASNRPLVFNPDLAVSLYNLSLRLSVLGCLSAALDSLEEAVRIQRQLAADLPEVHNPNLALYLHNISDRLKDLGRHEDALATSQEVVESSSCTDP